MESLEEDRVAKSVGALLRNLREQAGLSTRALATRAGISQAFLSQLERGASTPSVFTIYRLAEALEVPPGELLPVPPSDAAVVRIVRADEGDLIPVADRPDSAVGRFMTLGTDAQLDISEYRIAPGQYASEWWQLDNDGEVAIYFVTGHLDIEFDGVGRYRFGPGDVVAHPARLRNRWLPVDDQPIHLTLTMTRPSGDPTPGSRHPER
ncbi:helix-turn-helix domain-containing protein [Nocardia sp. alder85J]|uniref:helix-turn-helix domain-containing protein n=1 Tax=Nocardia sp. alder85J TaxID=2862949 RepID=UPI001CD3F987|nr:helix-turn-helix transcriptional regulator [Nocardia sp. alder85J]MCX4096996.1 helix-turn-helix transcriptional regulator [Nocardia sp. alder85J]